MSYELIPGIGAVEQQHSGELLPGGFLLKTKPASGSLSASETGSDSASLSGKVLVTGSLSASESGSDTASLSGTVSGTAEVPNVGGGISFSERKFRKELEDLLLAKQLAKDDEEIVLMVVFADAA